MKKLVLLLFISALCSISAHAQKNMAIGVRLGDPLGGTFKKYLDNNSALEFNFGFPTYFWGGYDYGYRYAHDNRYKNNGYYGYGYKNKFRYALQAHYLRQFDIKAVDGLQWLAGGGFQFRQNLYEYRYYDINGYYHEDNVVDTQFGLDVIGGAEYSFSGTPFTVFADINVFFNFIDGFKVYGQPGIGGRYNF